MAKQKHEMTNEELYDELRRGVKGSPVYDKYFPELEIRQAVAQIESAEASKKSARWIFITMVIIGVANAAFFLLQMYSTGLMAALPE